MWNLALKIQAFLLSEKVIIESNLKHFYKIRKISQGYK